jgi:quercetin dioxygenase-like cupin family protein
MPSSAITREATIMLEASKTTFSVKNVDSPDERRATDHGTLDVVNLPGASIVRATFQPGWRWSTDVAPVVGTQSCQVAHIGYIISGRFHVLMDDGREHDLGPGDAHVVAPGHDAWVIGDEPVVAIDIATTSPALAGHVGRCPCGVEFRVASDEHLDHLVAAIREHASGSHDHELTREQILAEVSAA